jgi:hypothetical protein
MIKPIPEQSEPTPKADAATAARRLRPVQAAPSRRDPRCDGCIDERLGGSITPSFCSCATLPGVLCLTLPSAGEDDD